MSEPVKTWVAPRAEDWTTMIFTLRFRFSYNNDNDQVDEDKGSSLFFKVAANWSPSKEHPPFLYIGPTLTHSDDGMERKRHVIDHPRYFVYVGVRRNLLELFPKF